MPISTTDRRLSSWLEKKVVNILSKKEQDVKADHAFVKGTTTTQWNYLQKELGKRSVIKMFRILKPADATHDTVVADKRKRETYGNKASYRNASHLNLMSVPCTQGKS